MPGSDGQTVVYCWLTLWYVHDGARSSPVPGVGGDMVIVKQSSGLRTDDEAFKKAFTDAIGNAMKHIGMSADVHMGRFDDSKYVNDLRREDAETHSAPTTGRIAAGAVDRTSDASAAPLSAPPRAEGSRPQSPAPSAVRPAAPLSDEYRLFIGTMKMARSRADLREWWEANKDAVKETLSESESLLLVGERNTLGASLPEFAEAA